MAEARLIACPFCGLVCDDLAAGAAAHLDVVSGAAALDTRGCAKAAAGFARRPLVTEHRIAGRPATLDAAAAAAAGLLRQARRPLFSGLAADLAGLRAVLALADRAGGVVDRWRSAVAAPNLQVMQHSGAFLATFGEVANRADAVLVIGRDPAPRYPRFFERLIRNKTPLYRDGAPWVGFLGAADAAPTDPAVSERLAAAPAAWPALLQALATLVAERPLRCAEVAGIAVGALQAVAERLRRARYGVIVWEVAAFPAHGAEALVAILLHMLRDLNTKTRCVGLPLGGDDNAQGVVQTLLWQAGWPGQVAFAPGGPEHDPWRWDAERLLAAGEADALVWVAALAAMPPPPAPATIALVAGDVTLAASAAVEIRVGIPGVDHPGAMVRADTVIALPLAAARGAAGPGALSPGALPSVAAAAAAILGHLGEAAPC